MNRTFAVMSALMICFAATARAGTGGGREMADFPPGTFSDGGHYHLSDFAGKIVVLDIFSSECPNEAAAMSERSTLAAAFKGKPVVFLSVAPGNTLSSTQQYCKATGLTIPTFADSLGVMQYRYGQQLSLMNIDQPRLIGPDGKFISYDVKPADIQAAVDTIKWKFKDDGYDPKLNPAIDLLEWNQWVAGMAKLRPFLKTSPKTLADSAQKLYDAVKVQGQQWSTDAAAAVTDDPGKAYDLYTRLAACFPEDQLGKDATAALKTLAASKGLQDELAARKMYDQLNTAMAKATPAQKPQVIAYCKSISDKYPETSTGKMALALTDELTKAPIPAAAADGQ